MTIVQWLIFRGVGHAYAVADAVNLGSRLAGMVEAAEPEPFIVWDTRHDRWVAAVDTSDGDVSNTPDRQHARIFTGSTWRDFFDRSRFRVVDPDTESPSFDDPPDEPRRR